MRIRHLSLTKWVFFFPIAYHHRGANILPFTFLKPSSVCYPESCALLWGLPFMEVATTSLVNCNGWESRHVWSMTKLLVWESLILKALPNSFRAHPIGSLVFFIILSFPTWIDWKADSDADDLTSWYNASELTLYCHRLWHRMSGMFDGCWLRLTSPWTCFT